MTMEPDAPTSAPSPPLSDMQQALAHHAGRRPKRDRVIAACQRCQRRKQKCNGARPTCASCEKHSLVCTYVAPAIPGAGERKLYIKALEQRVAELESQLAGLGQHSAGADHYHYDQGQPQPVSSIQHDGPVQQSPSTVASGQLVRSPDDGGEIMIAVRDLSLSAAGHYVGASSHIDVGRVLSSVVSREGQPSSETAEVADPAPKSANSARKSSRPTNGPQLTSAVAERLVKGWEQHICTRYPVLHTPRVRWLYENKDRLTDVYDRAMLHLVFAVSGRWLESAGEMGYFFSEEHFDLTIAQMDHIQRLRDERTVDYLLLLTLYCTRAPRDPGAWTYIGAAMRLCIELGLHRKRPRAEVNLESELSKRRFWTAYFLDRDISIAIGRPPGICDHDIDAEILLDVDEAAGDEEVRQAWQNQFSRSGGRASTLTPFIHRLRLKRIESEIQHSVYRVDIADATPRSLIDLYLQRLNDWKSQIPFEAGAFDQWIQADVPYDGYEFYTIHYHRCVRFLLYPQLSQTPMSYDYVKTCAEACQGIISDYRSLHRKFPVGFSALSIQSVFLSGLTLVYCMYLTQNNLAGDVQNSLNDCMLLLYIVCERYPSARRYRDVFERVKSASTTIPKAQTHYDPRHDTGSLPDAPFQDPNQVWSEDLSTDLLQMIDEMSGQAIDPFLGMSTHPDATMRYPLTNTWWT